MTWVVFICFGVIARSFGGGVIHSVGLKVGELLNTLLERCQGMEEGLVA